MSRIKTCLANLSNTQRKALIPYITAGDPSPSITVSLMHTLVQAGADLIELGMPFSDPMAEGPVIQAAHERALAHGTKMRDILAMVTEFRQKDDHTPIILMGYLNPLESMGYQNFTLAAKQAGVDGVLIVDMPPEEGHDLTATLRQHNIDQIYLIAPTTDDSRIKAIKSLGSGYHYYVSLKGVTGAKKLEIDDVSDKLAHFRRHLSLPICVGFGIKDAETAKEIAKIADGVVIGSAIIDRMAKFEGDENALLQDVTTFISGIRAVL